MGVVFPVSKWLNLRRRQLLVEIGIEYDIGIPML
jgi:hypothetical protein